MSTALERQQRELQNLILGDCCAADVALQLTGAEDGHARVSIYATAYRLRMQEALAANFPMLAAHLGPERFGVLAPCYIDAHPSRHASIRQVGTRFARWLRDQHTDEPWLAEFAHIEWTLADAFDAPDDTPLTPDALVRVAPEDWPSLVFRFSTAVQHLTLVTNAAELYRAATLAQPATQGRSLSEPGEWLVWRTSLQAQYRSLAPAEASALNTLIAGGTFGDACERLAQHAQLDAVPSYAASLLKRWLEDELIVRAELAHA